jgi:hypothetical protein
MGRLYRNHWRLGIPPVSPAPARAAVGLEFAELAAVTLAGDDGIDHGIAELRDDGELSFDELARGFVLGLEQATPRDGGEIAVVQSDRGKALLPPFEGLFDEGLLGAEPRLADKLADGALPRDKADDWYRPIGVAAFDQLGQFGALASEPCGVGRTAGQPEG